MYSTANFKTFLRHTVLLMVCALGMTACFTLSTLPSEGTDPAIAAPGISLPHPPEYYLSKTYSDQQIRENRRLTVLALQRDLGKIFVQTDGKWININEYELLIYWHMSNFVGSTYEKRYGMINEKTFIDKYEENSKSGFFASSKKKILDDLSYSTELRGNADGSLTSVNYGYRQDGHRYVRYVSLENLNRNDCIQVVTFVLSDKGKWMVSQIFDAKALPDGRISETTIPYKSSYGDDNPTTMYMVSVSSEAFVTLGPLVKQREAERRQEEAQGKQARSDARWATFGAIVQGVGQAASDVAAEQNAELAGSNNLNNTLAQITQDAARKRRAELAAEQQTQASTHETQQQAGREAAARQLAAANAYRSQLAAQTSDPATLRRLQADNEKALLAARQLGVEQQVREQADAQQRQAGARTAQVKQEATQQAPVSARGKMSGSMVAARQLTTSRNPVVHQSLPQGGSQLSVSQGSPINSLPVSTAVQYQTAAMAWCYRKPTSGAFLCSGPLQMMTIVGESDLNYALKLAGCSGGEGKVPGIGASEKFNCGRMLAPIERRVGDRSPYPD